MPEWIIGSGEMSAEEQPGSDSEGTKHAVGAATLPRHHPHADRLFMGFSLPLGTGRQDVSNIHCSQL